MAHQSIRLKNPTKHESFTSDGSFWSHLNAISFPFQPDLTRLVVYFVVMIITFLENTNGLAYPEIIVLSTTTTKIPQKRAESRINIELNIN